MSINPGMNKKSKLEKLKKPKLIIGVAAVILILIGFYYIFGFVSPSRGALETYIKEEGPFEPNQTVTLIVEYKNTLGEDIDEVRIEVEPIAMNKIEVMGEREVTEGRIGMGELRQFQFPINLKNVSRGSTYSVEIRAITPEEEFTSRTFIEIGGFD